MKTLFRPLVFCLFFSVSSLPLYADTLASIYELALKNDAKLKSAEATYKANLENEEQSFSVLLPQVNASADYASTDGNAQSESFFPLNGTPVFSSSDDDTNNDIETYQLTLSQKLFDLSAWYTFKQGKSISAQATAQFAADQQDLIIRVARAYFDVLRARDNLEATKAEERATKRQLEQTQQRFDVGLIAITDVHEARAVYDDNVVRRLTDEGILATSYEALTVLTGLPHSDLWLLDKDFPVINPDPLSRGEWVQFSLINNYSLKASIAGMEAAMQNASAKKMGHAPTVSARASYTKIESDGSRDGNEIGGTNKPFTNDSEDTLWGVTLNVPIYSGGGVSAQRRQAYEQYNAALQNKIETQRNVVQNTRSTHITLVTDVQRVKAREQAIVSTSSALDATQAGYEVGTRNIVDVLQAQRALFGSIRDYANSRYDYVLNLLRLKEASGMLNPQDIYDLNKWIVSPDSPKSNRYQEYLKPNSTTP